MSRRNNDKGRLPPFVPLLRETISTPAWRALSHGARSLYIAHKQRYSNNLRNNGRLYLSSRDAAEELGSNRESILRWFQELEYYGFIVKTQAGALGVDGKGKAPHWRLTEIGYMADLPTRDFIRWNGVKFAAAKKQNPGPNSGSRVDAKLGPPVVPIVGPLAERTGRDSGSICAEVGGTSIGSITSITTPTPADALDIPAFLDRRRELVH